METKTPIQIETVVNAPVEIVWKAWNEPEHVVNWTHASDDWHTPHAENDLKVGGKFLTRMAAKDGSISFDLIGTYTEVQELKSIGYTMEDGRTVHVIFEKIGDTTKVIEFFDPENENPIEMQRGGWQAILDNFKKYTEAL
jgi:uncharacterized protein YndB with AHSA1/START domain